MRLYSSVIKLLNLHSTVIPPPGGQHAHAAFLDIIRQVDPSISQALHDHRGKGVRQPFTVSPLFDLPQPIRIDRASVSDSQNKSLSIQSVQSVKSSGRMCIYLPEGWRCWLRITILDETLFKSFIDYFLNLPAPSGRRMGGKAPRIRLGDAHFLVSEILTTPGSHPWAGFTTLEELKAYLDQPPPTAFTFEFHSPTSFKLQGSRVELIPYPKHVFGSLAAAWKTLTSEDFVEAIEKFAQTNLRLVLHRLERRALTLHNHPQLGCIGRAEYQLSSPEDTPMARALNLLAGLAFYTGLGRKTAQGMGMVRRLEN